MLAGWSLPRRSLPCSAYPSTRVPTGPIPEGVARHSDTPADKATWEQKEKTVEKAIAAQALKNL
jgi:hypothetical protein